MDPSTKRKRRKLLKKCNRIFSNNTLAQPMTRLMSEIISSSDNLLEEDQIEATPIFPVKYYHFGIQNGLCQLIPILKQACLIGENNLFKLKVGIDGLPLFEHDCWILAYYSSN